jgi:hypothetical protein
VKTVTITTSKGRGEAREWSVETKVQKPESADEWADFWAANAPNGLHNELAFDALIVYRQGTARRSVEGNAKKGIAPKIGSERQHEIDMAVSSAPYSGGRERTGPTKKVVKLSKIEGIDDAALEAFRAQLAAQGVELA